MVYGTCSFQARTCGSNQDNNKDIHTLPPQRITKNVSNSSVANNNWSGYEATGARGTYRASQLCVNVPTLTSSSYNGAWDSEWTGVGGNGYYAGGNNNVVLPQVGIISQWGGQDNCGDNQFNKSFYEVYSQAHDTGIVDLPLNRLCVQDLVNAYVSSDLNNDGYDYFYINNTTISNYNSAYDHYSYDLSDSATGECMQERTKNSANGQWIYIADPNPNAGSLSHTIHMENCIVWDNNGNWNHVGNWPNISPYVVNCVGYDLLDNGPLFNNSGDFNEQFHSPGGPTC